MQRTCPSRKRHNLRQSAKFKAKLALWEAEGRLHSPHSASNNAATVDVSKPNPITSETQIFPNRDDMDCPEVGVFQIETLSIAPEEFPAPNPHYQDAIRTSAVEIIYPVPWKALQPQPPASVLEPEPPFIVPVKLHLSNPRELEGEREFPKKSIPQDLRTLLQVKTLALTPEPGPSSTVPGNVYTSNQGKSDGIKPLMESIQQDRRILIQNLTPAPTFEPRPFSIVPDNVYASNQCEPKTNLPGTRLAPAPHSRETRKDDTSKGTSFRCQLTRHRRPQSNLRKRRPRVNHCANIAPPQPLMDLNFDQLELITKK